MSQPDERTRRLVQRRDAWKCARCGRDAGTHWSGDSIHHRRPRSHPWPGLHQPANLLLLCGKPIDLTLKTPHPLSCELDEIIPYSRGGSPTSYDNTQLTHRICNQRKSDKITNTTGHQNTKKQPQNTIPISRQW